MKKIILFILAISIGFFAQAQEVPQTQSSLIIKKTATWCPPCGGWGWDLFEQLISDNEGKAILWAMHYSGDLQSATTQGISANLSGAGQPRFYLDNVDQGSSSAAIRSAIMSGVNQNAAKSPIANAVATNISVANNQISLTVKSKFFTEVTGDYFLDVYVVENGVKNNQAGQGPNAIHEKVLRDEMAGTVFGDLLASGTIMANSSYSTDFSIPVANDWNPDNTELSVIIWKKNGTKYDFVNGTEATSIVAGLETPSLKNAAMTISPNPVARKASISLEFATSFSGELGIFDLTGRLVKTLALNGSALIGNHSVDFDTENLENGVYLVRLSSADGMLTQKMVISH